ncbi:hypothetical protein [Treponema pectinovorum]|uniref:hypothetical protein n=1 Tax=Treponema pectinovorum TaxID=164 RepID=UPI0011CAD608|nr:hypothetical protein [Treponema pectinovorum]
MRLGNWKNRIYINGTFAIAKIWIQENPHFNETDSVSPRCVVCFNRYEDYSGAARCLVEGADAHNFYTELEQILGEKWDKKTIKELQEIVG